MIIFRELNFDSELFTNVVACDLLLEAGDERLGTELEVITLALAAFESNAVLKSFVVDCNCVAFLSRTVFNFLEGCISLSHTLDLSVNVLVCNYLLLERNFNALVLAEFKFRLNVNCDCVLDAVLVDVCYIHLRSGYNLEVVLLNCFRILSISDLVHSVLIKYALTVILANELIRNLALTEAGNLETVLVLVVSLL